MYELIIHRCLLTLTGRCTYRHQLEEVATSIRFLNSRENAGVKGASSDSMYSLCFSDRVVVHDAERGTLVNLLTHDSRVNDTTVHNDLLVSGTDNGTLCGWDLRVKMNGATGSEGNIFTIKNAHNGSRIKGVSSMPISDMIGSGSSNGLVRIWDIRKMCTNSDISSGGVHRHSDKTQYVAQVNSDARISCLSVGSALKPTAGTNVDYGIKSNSNGSFRKINESESIYVKEKKTGGLENDPLDTEIYRKSKSEKESRTLSKVYRHLIEKNKSTLRRIRLRSTVMSMVSTKIESFLSDGLTAETDA